MTQTYTQGRIRRYRKPTEYVPPTSPTYFDNQAIFDSFMGAVTNAERHPLVQGVRSFMVIYLPDTREFTYVPAGYMLRLRGKVRNDGRVVAQYDYYTHSEWVQSSADARYKEKKPA